MYVPNQEFNYNIIYKYNMRLIKYHLKGVT